MPEVETGLSGRALALREVFQANKAEIHSVTVYRDRAEVRRSVRVRLEAGENEIVVSGLPACTDKNSIRVEGLSGVAEPVIITDVVYATETKPLRKEGEGEEGNGEYERLKSVIEEKQKELKHLEFKATVLEKERRLLEQFAGHVTKVSHRKKHNNLPGLLEGGALGAVLEFMERYQTKLAQIDSRELEVKGQQSKLSEEVKVMQAKADAVNPEKGKKTEDVHSVSISLESGVQCDVHLLVSYVVSCAAWSSSYDVRVFTNDKTMKLQYYGLIKQWTGEDWENASISLSTAQPSIGGSAPDLPTRIIRFQRPTPLFYRSSRGFTSPRRARVSYYAPPPDGIESSSEDEVGFQLSSMAVETAQVEASLFSSKFSISRKTTIPSDNTEHKVTVALIDLTPEFRYVSAPRLSPYSFLQASTTNTSPYALLAGPANVFLDNNFIAKSELSDVSPGEQFKSSLGVDQAIRITCQPVAVVHSTARGLSRNKIHTYTHSIKVKNTRQDKVEIEVSEQFPLSQDDRIKVQIMEPEVKKTGTVVQLPYGHAILNDSHNIEWHMKLAADTEQEVKLVYSVEHSAQDRVDGLPKV